MSDYISREAAIEKIRVAAGCAECDGNSGVPCCCGVCDVYNAICLIKRLPAVPPVGRCRDCQKWHRDEGWCDEQSHFVGSNGEACHPWESSNWKMFDENYFCADFVPKEDKSGNKGEDSYDTTKQ